VHISNDLRSRSAASAGGATVPGGGEAPAAAT
jgi:hypothetical protein